MAFAPSSQLYQRLAEHCYERVKTADAVAACVADPVPNRHAAIHGLVSYTSHLNSLNMLIMADFIFYVVHRIEGFLEEERAEAGA
jgi:hypothetical protein